MGNEKMGREALIAKYRPDVERLVPYLPWLTGKTGKDVTSTYETEDGKSKTLSFPVYDSMLMTFLNDLGGTVFMDQNYRYVYSRYHIRDWRDELREIDRATIMNMEILCGIFSHYVLGGMTKASLWTEGIEHGIFLEALTKAKNIIEFWDVPFQTPDHEMQNVWEEDIQETGEVTE